MEQLYRAIVGNTVEPILKGDGIPSPYRQSVQRPLAPTKGSVSDEPSKADSPLIAEQSEIS